MHDIDIGQALFNLLGLLSHASFNFWPYLFFAVLPVLIFSVRPSVAARLRVARIIIAIILGYIFINISLQTSHNIVWDAYETCQSQFSDGAIQHHKECGEMNIADGASYAFAMLFGWIPSAAYVGIWELTWRRVYRKQRANKKTWHRLEWITNFPIWMLYVWFCLPVFLMFLGLVRHYIE